MAPQTYDLAGESKALYNGATDTLGGIWVRIRDENDRRLAQAAVDKQLKNREAAIGTLSALDPNSGHLLDYVAEALNRVKDGLNGARPSAAQLDGTPMGASLASPPDATDGTPKTRAKRGGKPSTVGELLKTVPGGPLSPPSDDAIVWGESVPTPRPAKGDVVRTAQGHTTTVAKVIGYDGLSSAFRVFDSADWDGLVYAHNGEWRILTQTLDYTDDGVGDFPADALAAGETSLGKEQDAAHEQLESETPYAKDEAAQAAAADATPPAAPSAQRARNARHAGLGKPDGKLPETKKGTSAKKAAPAKSGAKKRGR
jgi:hypothetical protein